MFDMNCLLSYAIQINKKKIINELFSELLKNIHLNKCSHIRTDPVLGLREYSSIIVLYNKQTHICQR